MEYEYEVSPLHMPVIRMARSLACDPDDQTNPEYDRAVVELTAGLIGMAGKYSDDPEGITRLILGR